MAFITTFLEGSALFLFLVVQWTILSPHLKLNCFLSALHGINYLSVPLRLAMTVHHTEKENLYCYICIYRYVETPNSAPKSKLSSIPPCIRHISSQLKLITLYCKQSMTRCFRDTTLHCSVQLGWIDKKWRMHVDLAFYCRSMFPEFTQTPSLNLKDFPNHFG